MILNMHNFFDNDILFYGMLIGVACHLGFSFCTSLWTKEYKDANIQTDAWEDYSDRTSQIIQTSETSIDTVTPRFSPVEYINTGAQTTVEGTNTVTTILPIPPMHMEIVPNPELITKANQGVQTINNPMFGKDWNTIIEFINNKPSFFFDTPGCDTWIIPDPSVLTLISNSFFW